MTIEELVDDFWRDALLTNATGPQAEKNWTAFVLRIQARVERFPKAAQDEVFLRAATHNAECIAIARRDLNALRIRLGVPPTTNSRLAEVAADTLVRATVWQGVSAFFRLFR